MPRRRSRKTTSVRSEMSVRKSLKPAMGIEHKLADYFINEYNRIEGLPQDILSWAYLLDIDYNIVDKVIENRNIKASPLRILSTQTTKITYTKAYVFLELMEAIRQFIINSLQGRDDISYIQSVSDTYNIINFSVIDEVVEPFWLITRKYYNELADIPEKVITAVRNNSYDDLDDIASQYLREILALTTPLFRMDSYDETTVFEPIENERLNPTNTYLYGYLNILTSRNLIDSHIFAFIINNTTKTIELFDTNPSTSIKYKYYHMFINNLYEINYQLEIVNTSETHLQLITRSYRDLYCLGWSLIYIYNRLVRDYSIDDFRRVYIPNYLSYRFSELEEIYLRGFENEIKSFLWVTFLLLAPNERRQRHSFLRKAYSLLRIEEGAHKNYLYFLSLVPGINIDKAYY